MSILEGDPHTIQEALDEHARHVYVVLEPTTEDYQLARSLLLTDPGLGLRAPDVLHLAIAARHQEPLYTLDRTLLACANALGLPATSGGILEEQPRWQPRP